MTSVLIPLVLLTVAVVGQAQTPSTFFTNVDKERMRSLFRAAKPYGDDLQNMYQSVSGIRLLGGAQEEPYLTCEALKKHVKTDDIESLFYASSVIEILKGEKHKTNCQVPWGNAQQVLEKVIATGSTSLQLYHAITAAKNLGYKIDETKAAAALDDALKSDDSPLSHGFVFHAASLLKDKNAKFHSLIEDMVAQADVTDDVHMSFEGGLYTTAVVIDGAYKLASAAKKAPSLTGEEAIKFANYFLSRKHVQSLKNAAALLEVVKRFTTNEYHIPVAVTLASQVSVSDKYPMVQVRVSNLLGQSLGNIAVTADTARHVGDDAVVISKKQFAMSTAENTLFEYDFLQVKPARGFYKISISVSPQQKDARLIGTAGAEVSVKVTTQVALEGVEIGVGDREQATPPRTVKLQYPNKANNVLEADHHQKVSMRFQLRDKSSHKLMSAHQTFVRLSNTKTGEEIIFVAETDSSDVYKFELDVGAKAKEFSHVSGKYNIELIVGDAVIQNPISWTLAEVQLSFPDSGASGEKQDAYSVKPEIQHEFRKPEKRPPTTVSNLFTGLVLVPLVLLVVLWAKIGVNMSNFPMSLSAVGFHLGMGAIFALYYCYWIQLNMFTTIRYLGIIGVPTFLFGNKLLSGIAAKRKQ